MSTMFRDFTAGLSAFEAPLDARLAFLRRTYLHVTGAVLAFAGISAALYMSGFSETFAGWALSGRWSWLLVIGAFALVGWMARGFARSTNSTALQYTGLVGFVAAEAIVFSPMIYLAAQFGGSALPTAAGLTVLAFGALSTFALVTKKDFSFLGPILAIAGIVALGTILCGVIFGFDLGIWFSAVMILFASGSVLYDTSKIVHDYRTDQHVSASIELFASIALLFWYVLRLLMQLQNRR